MAHQEIVWSPALPALHAGVLCDVRKWDGSTHVEPARTQLPTAILVSCYLRRVSLVLYKTQFAATCRFKHQDKQETAFSEIYHTFMCTKGVRMCVDVEAKVYTKHPQKHRLRNKRTQVTCS